MLGGLFNSRSARQASERADEAAALMSKLSAFGDNAGYNPVKDQISDLRARRNAGSMSEADYAARVADLLGASESVIGEGA
jgi:hypothetical protein